MQANPPGLDGDGPPGLDGEGPPGLGGETPRGWAIAKTKTTFNLSELMEDLPPPIESDIKAARVVDDIFGIRHRKNPRG
jgi:hypothetical protein